MSWGSDAFKKRERASEEVFFRQEERLHMIKRLEKLVEQGKMSPSVLDEIKKATNPDVHHVSSVEVSPGVFRDVPGEMKHREEYVYAHTPGGPPIPRESETERMKTHIGHVDMGPSKWSPGDQSIFNLGGALGEEPAAARTLPAHEAARLARLQKLGGEVPTLMGYRLPGATTPGKAYFWGSLLAIWGTAALVAASARGLGPGGAPPAPGEAAREPGTLSAMGQRLANVFTPWRTRVTERRASRAELEAEQGEFVRALKERMVAGRA